MFKALLYNLKRNVILKVKNECMHPSPDNFVFIYFNSSFTFLLVISKIEAVGCTFFHFS